MVVSFRSAARLGFLLQAVMTCGCSDTSGSALPADAQSTTPDAGPGDADPDTFISFRVRNTTAADIYLRKKCSVLMSVLELTLEGWRSVHDEPPDGACSCDRPACLHCDGCLLPIELVRIPRGGSYEVRWQPNRLVVQPRPDPVCPGAAASCLIWEPLGPGRYRVQLPIYKRGVDDGADPHGVLLGVAETSFRLPAERKVDLVAGQAETMAPDFSEQ